MGGNGTEGAGRAGEDTLTVQGVSVSFAGLVVLQAVDLHLQQGEILGLIGPNGAGKTTLLNVVTGFQVPTAGSVRIGDVDLTRWAPARRARAGVSRTFQSAGMFRALSVRENLEVASLGVGVGPRAAAARAARLLEHFGLAAVAEQEAGALSYGTERRLGIARALATEPRFLFLDEPAAGLNDAETAELGGLLRRLPAEHGCGLLVIEHDIDMICSTCDRVLVLDYGRTIYDGSTDGVLASPAVREAYLGAEVA